MENVLASKFLNSRNTLSPTKYIYITLLAICILQFKVFGTPGLIVYGLLIFWGIGVMVYCQKKRLFYFCHAFWLAVLYYGYYLFAIIINGSFFVIGPSVLQLFFLTLACFTLRTDAEIKDNIIAVAKVFSIAGISMCILSLIVSAVTLFLPSIVNQFPSWLINLMYSVKGTFPIRMTGFVGNANGTAGYVYITACLSFFLISQKPTIKWIVLAIGNIILSTITVFYLTASRTSMLALITFVGVGYVSYLLHLFQRKKDNKFRIHLTFAISLVLICVLLFCITMLFPQPREFFLERVLRIDSLATGSGRLCLYLETLNAGRGHRLFGISIDTLTQSTTSHVSQAHNNFLQALAIGGIPSLLFYTAFVTASLVTAFRLVWRTRKLPFQESILPVFILCMLVSQFVYGMTEGVMDRIGVSAALYTLTMALVHVVSHNHFTGDGICNPDIVK